MHMTAPSAIKSIGMSILISSQDKVFEVCCQFVGWMLRMYVF